MSRLFNPHEQISLERAEQPDEVIEILEAWEAVPLEQGTSLWKAARLRYMAELTLRQEFTKEIAAGFGVTPQEISEALRMIFRGYDGVLDIHRVPGGPWHTKDIGGNPTINRFETVLTTPEGLRISQFPETSFSLDFSDVGTAQPGLAKSSKNHRGTDNNRGRVKKATKNTHGPSTRRRDELLEHWAENKGSSTSFQEEREEQSGSDRVLESVESTRTGNLRPASLASDQSNDIMPRAAPASHATMRSSLFLGSPFQDRPNEARHNEASVGDKEDLAASDAGATETGSET
ncbi:MAG: hypothetical protein Q9174_001303 [Haloplaca sp. 1 TL-2023]